MDPAGSPAALLVATFKFNSISIDDGYIEADKVARSLCLFFLASRFVSFQISIVSRLLQLLISVNWQDEDGKVSETDLVAFCQDLQLGCPDDAVRAFYISLDEEAKGYIAPDVWTRALQAAEEQSQELLLSRGVSTLGTGVQDGASVDANADAIQTEGAVASGIAMDVDSAADQLAAALLYNDLSLEDAFRVLDVDSDDRISLLDLQTAAASLALNVSKGVLVALHQAMDEHNNGLVEVDAWCNFLSHRNTAAVLRSRGVDESQISLNSTGTQLPAAPLATLTGDVHTDRTPVQIVSDTIAALLDYNNLDNRQGFEAFDIDEDDVISMQDLKGAASSLALDVDEQNLHKWLQQYNKTGNGLMSEEEWNVAIDASNPSDILASRGIMLVAQDSVPATAMDVDDAADQLAAALRFNDLSTQAGFEALDADGDDRLSMGDLQAAVASLALQISETALGALHSAMDDKGNGLIEIEAWLRLMEGRNTDNVLKSRGVSVEVDGDKPIFDGPQIVGEIMAQEQAMLSAQDVNSQTSQLQTPINTRTFIDVQTVSDKIAALLDFNSLSHLDGFEAFDVDEDDMISIGDLKIAEQSLKLDINAQVR